jgi:mRNA interferase MazF
MRGDIYEFRRIGDGYTDDPRPTRYGVVVQSDELLFSEWLAKSSALSLRDVFEAGATWLVAPTSIWRRSTSYRPEVVLNGQVTRVLVEEITAVDPDELGPIVGRLSAQELTQLNAALRIVLGLTD